uniref:RRM domain-containing protein n=2 Tax=Wuchereria bancrofti TaxID=6293 RepID=A0AAF5RY61_WUCBA
MGSTGSTMIDAIGIPILNLDKNATSETIRDLIMTLGHAQEIGDISTAIESSLSTKAVDVGGLFSYRSVVSIFSNGNDDDNDDDDGGNNDDDDDNDDADNEITTSSRNYLQEWTPLYGSSLSIFATLSSGNFLSENEVTQIFSRYGNIKEVKWIQISDNNGYIIVFSNETEKEKAIKMWGDKVETSGRILKLWSFKRTRLFVNSKLAVVDATNCTSHQSTKDKDDNDPYVIGDAKLLGFTDPFQGDSTNCISKHQIPCYPNASVMTLKENIPSPERPGTRPSPATAFLLKQISETNVPETGQFYEKISRDSGNEKNRFLNLPAPYHLLPDTPYFRQAPIVPPPTRSLSTTEQMPIQQRIINRYLASMKIDDENGFAVIARYEQECYKHLCVSSYYPLLTLPEQQPCAYLGMREFRKGAGRIGDGFDTGLRIAEDQTMICTGNSTNNDWSTILSPCNQHYEIWDCAPLWTWNFNFKE